MKFFICFILCLLCLPSYAQPREKFLDIQELKTPSGISVWLAEDHTLPIINLQFTFLDSGTALDPADKQGLVRMLSNTMDEGAGELDSQTFQKTLSDQSITLRFSAARDGFGGTLETLTRDKDKAFDLLSMALNAPRFDDEPVGRMRDSNISRIKSSMTEPDWMAARLINDRAFGKHPYAMNSGGTLSSLPRITPDDLRAFRSNLTQDRLFIAVAGDIKPDALLSAIDHIFGKLPKENKSADITDTSIQNPGSLTILEHDIPQTLIEVMMPAFDRADPDYYALQVMNYIFGGSGFGSRLMTQAREKDGLTYGIYSSLANYRHADALSISTSTKNESASRMMDIIRAEMIRMKTDIVPDQELADAKSYLTGSMPLALTATGKISGMMLSMRTENLPADYLDQYATKINSVTAQDVKRVSQRVLKPDQMTTIMVGKPLNVAPTEKIESLPNVE